MCDLDKVLHGLSSCGYCDGIPNVCGVTECPYESDKPWCTHYLARDAGELMGELLKAQEPVKPTIEHNPAGQPMWCCGNCGTTLFFKLPRQTDDENERSQYRFCHYCGKAVKWE